MPDEAETDWKRVLKYEDKLIKERRAWLNSTGWDCPQPPAAKVGLALSGGGIRSATFSLGLMKSLSKSKLVHSIDYLSTVSGGGYAGAFYCSLFVPNKRRGAAPSPTSEPDEEEALAKSLGPDVLGSKAGRQALAQLRQGGHYLAPNGTSDALFAAVIAVRNWFAVALVTGLATLGIFLLIDLLMAVTREPVVDLARALGREKDVAVTARPWVAVLTVLTLWPAACAWAYWFTRSGHVPESRLVRLFSIQSLIALALVALMIWPGATDRWPDYLRIWIPVTSALALLTYALAELVSFGTDYVQGAKARADNCVEALAQEDRVRNRLSRWLLRGVFVLAVVGFIALIDFGVDRIFFGEGAAPKLLDWPFSIPTGNQFLLLFLTGFVLFILSRFVLRREEANARSRFVFDGLLKRARRILALGAGLSILVLLLICWATLARVAAGHLAGPESALTDAVRHLPAQFWRGTGIKDTQVALGILTATVLLAAYLLGQVDALLNRSSLAAFYSGRLRAAYLGATNTRRRMPVEDDEAQATQHAPVEAVDRDDPNDEITLDAYYREPLLAPLHLINVTINETTSRSSRVIQRDRKGKSMTVAPSGYLYPPNAPSEPLALLRRENTEDLPLSSWVAISGAAFTTGAGSHTSLGTAMLAALTNMRLGYWWDRTRPSVWGWRRPSKTVQAYLLRELRANYEGTAADRWYLSDGGHYENTGVYELVRRRVAFIIASDNGADPNYEFSDVVSLIRKLRIDFEAEVEFLDDAELDDLFRKSALREVFGTLEKIRDRGEQAVQAAAGSTQAPKAGPYATLARIRYLAMKDEGTAPSTLLLIKPRITGKELPDLLQYREVNAAFPQQPTTNQFFDEAQWESYYRLGQLIGDMIFDKDRLPPTTAAIWRPWALEPLARSHVRRRRGGRRKATPATLLTT